MKRDHTLHLQLTLALCAGLLLSACAPAQVEHTGSAPTPVATAIQETYREEPTAREYASLRKTADAYTEMMHGLRRAFPAPAVGNEGRTERGDWSIGGKPDGEAASGEDAAKAFLQTANALFDTAYTPANVNTYYCRDNTGNRAHLWRIESQDGVLVGAVDAETLDFISADCVVQPADALHDSFDPSYADGAGGIFDATERIQQTIAALGATVAEAQPLSARSQSNSFNNYGWNVQQDYCVSTGDGRYVALSVYGDANLTPESVGVCPDADCAGEQVYWRADLERHDAVSLVAPQDFRAGTPGAGDMERHEAAAFYDRFVQAANGLAKGAYKEPALTFYEDHSGARDDYWHIEGEYLSCDLTNRGHMLNARCSHHLMDTGAALGLMDIPYEDMGEDAYIEAIKALFTAVFGPDAVKLAKNNATVDGHVCTMHVLMHDGAAYEMYFRDGLISGCTFFSATEDGWGIRPNWDADWLYKNNETGETFYQEW